MNKPLSQKQAMSEPIGTADDWKNYVFPDFKAISDLCLRNSRDLIYEEVQVHGFEIYIVEQWTDERKISSLITSYTGNSQDVVSAVRICLPANQHYWPQNFKEYLAELETYAQAKVVNNDTLFITNLSSFPSTLNLLSIECGDLRQVWDNFRTNFNLKKLNCGGRSALLLKGPTRAALNKFSQLYKIQLPGDSSDNLNADNITEKEPESSKQNDGSSSSRHYKFCPVTELVSLVQIALNYFMPEPCVKMVDGLLCSKTRKAIDYWWSHYGKFYLGIEKPRNEIVMGPTTVASLFSLLLTCYFKLMVEDTMSAKDPFDELEFYAGLYLFQKKYSISKIHHHTYLDQTTIQKLFEVSTKSTSNDIFNLKKVVKSTVQDFAGKGNFMHLSNEILTSDLSVLVRNLHGGALSALWKGKDRDFKVYARRRSVSFVNKSYHHGDPVARLREQQNLKKITSIDPKDMEELYPHALRRDNAVFDSLKADDGLSSETSSISSMINNYETIDTKENSQVNFSYHTEFYRRNSIPFINDGTKIHKKVARSQRRNSVSQLADNLEKWSLPFNSSVIRIARDLLRINTIMNKTPTTSCYGYDTVPLDEHEETHGMDTENFKNNMATLEKFSEQYDTEKKFLESRQTEIARKEAYLEKEVDEANILASRFKYNIRILTARIKEVENSINRFDAKLSEIDEFVRQKEYPIACEVDPENDKEGFDEYIQMLSAARKRDYKGVSWNVLSTRIFQTSQQLVQQWYNWIFS